MGGGGSCEEMVGGTTRGVPTSIVAVPTSTSSFLGFDPGFGGRGRGHRPHIHMAYSADGMGELGGPSLDDAAGDDDINVSMGVDVVVDGSRDDGDDSKNRENSIQDDDDYAMSEISPVAIASAASTAAVLPVVDGGEDEGGVDDDVASDDTMSTRRAPLTTGGIHVVEELIAPGGGDSESMSLSSDDASTIFGILGGTNLMMGEVSMGVGGDAVISSGTTTTTIACTDDDAIIETKDYDLVWGGGDENSNNSNKLVRLLLRRPNYNNDDVEREARKEETERAAAQNARKWNEWMVSGRKVRDGDDDDAELDSSTSESSSSSLDGVDGIVDGAGSEAAAAITIAKNASISSSISNADIIAFGESSSENKSDDNTDWAKAISISPPSPDVVFDRTVTASGGRSAMTIGRAIVRGIVASRFADRLKAMMRRRPSDDNGDSSARTMIRTKAAAVRVREPGRISASDWRDNILNMPNSTILRDVQDPVMWVFVWATSWSIVYECLTRLVASAARGAFASPNGGGDVAGYFSWWGGGVAATTPSEAGWVRFAAWTSRRMCLPTLTHSMMVSAMSLLLVFRTNSAYQRFAEGRRVHECIYFFQFRLPPSLLLTPARAQSLAPSPD